MCTHRECKRGGGVGILITNKLQYRERKDLTLNIPNFENITIELKTHNDSILLSALYRPPNTNEIEFIKNYKRLLNKFNQNEISRLVLGLDHNLDFIKHDKHRPTKEFIELNLDHQLLPNFTKPTRITKSSSTLIDNIIIGKKYQMDYEPTICISDISDHLPLVININNMNPYKLPKTKIETRKLDNNKIATLNNRIQSVDWSTELRDMDANESFNNLHSYISNQLNDIAPIKTFAFNDKKLIRNKWLTSGLLKCMTKQRQLYKKTLQNNSKTQDHEQYKTYRNTLKKIIRKAKESYYKEQCQNFKRNTSKLWKMINKITNNTRDKSLLIEYLTIGNIQTYNAKEIATEFANYFASVGTKYANKIEQSTCDIHTYLTKIKRNHETLYLTPTTASEITNLIHNLPNKNSRGHDDISNKMLKLLHTSIVHPLVIIFNKSLTEGKFPDLMKLADIVPIHKANEKYLTTNYRPISLLITVSKLLEKVMYKRTYNFFTQTDQLYQSQYGFRAQHSCKNAIGELIGEIVKGHEHRKHTLAVFLDLSKAFDTLSHKILLAKLERYGIRGTSWKWYESYLDQRKLRVKCMTESSNAMEYSDYCNIDYGTLQGSCLGPLLFLIFTNDLHHCVENGNCLLFADNTTLYFTHQNLTYLKWGIEDDLKRVMDWFRANKLTLNLNKTVCVLFSHKTPKQHFSIKIGSTTITSTENAKFLGIWLDHKLTCRKHTNTLLIKLKQNTNLLKVSNKFLTKACKKIIYFAHIQSHISYGLSIWGNLDLIDNITKTKIQKCMDTCFKLITHTSPTKDNYKSEKMLNLQQLTELENLKIGYKLHENALPVKLARHIKTDSRSITLSKQHKYNTRNKGLFNLPCATSKLYHKSYLYSSIKSYNSLPSSLRNTPNYRTFVKKSQISATWFA